MVIVKFLRVLLIIFVFLTAFFPVYINVSAFAKGEISPNGIQYSRPDRNDLLLEEFTDQDLLNLIEAIEDAIENDPTDRSHYEMLAIACYNAGLYYKSLEATKKQLELHPKKGTDVEVIYSNLGLQYLNLGKLEEAKKALRKSLKLNPQDVFSHQHLLQYYIIKKQFKEAALEMKVLSELDRDFDIYHDSYWFATHSMENSELVKLLKEAVRANPNHPVAHRKLAAAIRDDLGNIEENWLAMMKAFRKALELDPKDAYTYITIANAYLFRAIRTEDKRYYVYSFKWLVKGSKVASGHTDLAYAKGNLLYYMELYDQAIKNIKYAISRGKNDDGIYEVLAKIYNGKAYSFYESGENLEEGLEIIDKAIFLKPNDGTILSTKAEILYKMGRFEEAYEYIKKGIKLEPDHPEIRQDLINIEKALKEARGKR